MGSCYDDGPQFGNGIFASLLSVNSLFFSLETDHLTVCWLMKFQTGLSTGGPRGSSRGPTLPSCALMSSIPAAITVCTLERSQTWFLRVARVQPVHAHVRVCARVQLSGAKTERSTAPNPPTSV